MSTKAITIFYDKMKGFNDIQLNKRFENCETTVQTQVLEKTINWLEKKYQCIVHSMLKKVDTIEHPITKKKIYKQRTIHNQITQPLVKRRGRPPASSYAHNIELPIKRRVGRPSNNSLNPAQILADSAGIGYHATVIKRGVGRPPKQATA